MKKEYYVKYRLKNPISNYYNPFHYIVKIEHYYHSLQYEYLALLGTKEEMKRVCDNLCKKTIECWLIKATEDFINKRVIKEIIE
jgi:hypothetical protein